MRYVEAVEQPFAQTLEVENDSMMGQIIVSQRVNQHKYESITIDKKSVPAFIEALKKVSAE